MSSLPWVRRSISTSLVSTCRPTRSDGCAAFTCATASGSSVIAGAVMVPMLTEPKRPAFSASISSCAWLRLASAMRAWRIMVSPYHVGRTPRGSRSNSFTSSMSSRSFSSLEAAGCVMFNTCAAPWILPSSSIATRRSSWRVLRRARMNQWVSAVDMFPDGTIGAMDRCLNVYGKTPKIY